MAESLLGGLLGEEDEKAEVEAPSALAGAEAFAAAVASRLSASDPEVARHTSAFLKKQAQILETQNEHLKEEHAARLHFLQGQAREVDIRRFGLRLRVGFQLFIALLATAIAVALIIMVHDAVTSRSVIVDPFETPAALEGTGTTGKVVAAGVLDELNRLQAATRSSSAKRDLSSAWSHEVTLSVPETGVSLGEISRALKSRFGHDLHIEGALIETKTGGLRLTVRGNGVPAMSLTAGSDELDKLTVKAAEYVYSQSQPALWATYLASAGRNDEAIEFSRIAYSRSEPADRPYLLSIWGVALQSNIVSKNGDASLRTAIDLTRTAIKLKPDFWVGYANIVNYLWALGDEENAWRTGVQLYELAGSRPGKVPETYFSYWDGLTWNLLPWLNGVLADVETNGGAGTYTTAAGPIIADVYWRLHDPTQASLALETTTDDATDPTIPALTNFVKGRLASEAGDVATAAAKMEAFEVLYANSIVWSNFAGYNCWTAPAEEAAGHPEKADAVLKTAGTFVDCYRFRADILAGRGDWTGAQKAYADAVALAPDLPAAYYSWGVSLAKHDDLNGAISKLKEANIKGPHWADPLKAWGDVLVKQGKQQEAIAKYDEASKYAPNWKQLQKARDAATMAKT
jgi:tetratricopeptide (TPR) repeat protein